MIIVRVRKKIILYECRKKLEVANKKIQNYIKKLYFARHLIKNELTS